VLSDGGSIPPASTTSDDAKSEMRQTDIDPVVAAYLADVDLASIREI
jgi:hypothetical protein